MDVRSHFSKDDGRLLDVQRRLEKFFKRRTRSRFSNIRNTVCILNSLENLNISNLETDSELSLKFFIQALGGLDLRL
jgi:hypothetical protein